MKVLICNRHRHHVVGGSEIQCDLIARHLHQRGHEVVYAAMESPRSLEAKSAYAYRIRALPKVGAGELFVLLQRERPDLVYWRYNRNYFQFIGLLCKHLGLKSVFSISSRSDVERWLCAPALETERLLERALDEVKRLGQRLWFRADFTGFRRFDGVVSLSRDLLQLVPEADEGPRYRTCIYNSMDGEEKIDFDWPRPYIAWVANLRRCKNPEVFVDLARRLQHTPVDFLMIGECSHEDFRYLQNPQHWPTGFYYLGPKPLPLVNGILERAICLVHSCNPEGFGNVFIQAWQQQTPTVSLHFDPDSLIETFGLGHHSRTMDRLVRDVEGLIQNPRECRRIGERAKTLAEELFDPGRNVARYESFFKLLLTGH